MNVSLRILKAVSESPMGTVDPKQDISSPIAYTWPAVVAAAACRVGQEWQLMETLADGEYLERLFRDRVLLCPFSKEFHVAFREICPKCRSADMERQEMIHHYRCGFVGPEKKFNRGGRLVCPKCDHILKHIGVDYERPSEVFTCNDCDWVGSTPMTEGHCIGCGKIFDPDQAIDIRINSYRLTGKGALAIEQNALIGGTEKADVIDPAFGTLSSGVVMALFKNLCALSQRHNRPMSVICGHFDQFHSLDAQKGLAVSTRVMKRIVDVVRGQIRNCDILSVAERHTFILIMPETPHAESKTVANKILDIIHGLKFEDTDGRVTISIGLASAMENQENENLIEIAANLAEQASKDSGDRILSAGGN